MTEPQAERTVPFITRVRLKNYKSIAECDVRLGPLTILVGPNGSGKSNFLDALAFVARAVEATPAEAIEERGGLAEVIRRAPEQAESFRIAITAKVPWAPSADQGSAHYELQIGPSSLHGIGAFEVIREECAVQRDGETWRFHREREHVSMDPPVIANAPLVEPDQLFLLAAGTQAAFAPLRVGLNLMKFYNFNTETLRKPQRSDPRSVLGRDGEHLGDVLAAMAADSRGYKARFDAYMRAVVQDVTAIEPNSVGGYTTVALRAGVGTGGEDVKFGPQGMSDGTIRSAAVLAALFQPIALDGRLPLVGIEEPEIALHPAAAGVLFDALTEASEHVQVLATSQSADLLDREDLDISTIRPVAMRDGLTVIGEVDDASREIADKKLYTLGELMRGNQLSPASANGGA